MTTFFTTIREHSPYGFADRHTFHATWEEAAQAANEAIAADEWEDVDILNARDYRAMYGGTA